MTELKEKFSSDFSPVTGTTEEKLTELVAIQQRLIDDHNKEGYECNRWYKYYRPRFQAVGREISTLKKQLSKDSPSLVDGMTGKEYPRHAEREKAGFDTLKKSLSLTDFFTGENPTKELPDPYENFSNYTEVDPNSDLTIGSGSATNSKITFDTVDQDYDCYIYKDFTADHFEDFEHKCQVKITAANNSTICYCGVANNVDDCNNWSYGIQCCFYSAYGSYFYYLIDCHGAENDYSVLNINTDYYMTVDRDGTAVNLYIRTGSHSGSLQDTVTVAVGSAEKYRYLYGFASYNDGNWERDCSGYVQDLDIQEATTNSTFFGMDF